jgi:hypothetical protein
MPCIPAGWKLAEGFTHKELEDAHIDPESLSNPASPAESKRLFGERAHRIGVA